MAQVIAERTAVLTAEELIVFAGGHGLGLPPGVPAVAARLGEGEIATVVLSQAARTLAGRGVSLGPPEGDEPPNPVLQAMLLTLCEPTARVVVVASIEGHSVVQAFSVGEVDAVIQSWLPSDVHLLFRCDLGELRAAVWAAAAVHELPIAAESPAELVLDAGLPDQLLEARFDRFEEVLAAVPGWASLSEADRSALVPLLIGRTPAVTMLFRRAGIADSGGDQVGFLAWGIDGGGRLWRIQPNPARGHGTPDDDGAPAGDGAVRLSRISRAGVESALNHLCDTFSLPS